MLVFIIMVTLSIVALTWYTLKVSKRLDQVITVLMEDAEHDYEERIEKMFDFLTEGLEPEDE